MNNTILQFVVLKVEGGPMVSGVTFDLDKFTVKDMCDLRDEIDKRMQEMAQRVLSNSETKDAN